MVVSNTSMVHTTRDFNCESKQLYFEGGFDIYNHNNNKSVPSVMVSVMPNMPFQQKTRFTVHRLHSSNLGKQTCGSEMSSLVCS